MSKIDALLDKAIKAGTEFEKRKATKAQEIDKASEAVRAAAIEIENAALDGDERAYAIAKEKHVTAQNRLEILQIRQQKKADKDDIDNEIYKLLDQLEVDCTAEMRKMFMDFISRYDELIKFVDEIDQQAKKYNSVRDYYKNHVLKSVTLSYRFMADMLPIKLVLSFRDKFKYNRSEIEKRIGTSNN